MLNFVCTLIQILAGSKRAIAICNRYEAFQMNSLTYNFDPTYMYLS